MQRSEPNVNSYWTRNKYNYVYLAFERSDSIDKHYRGFNIHAGPQYGLGGPLAVAGCVSDL